VIEGDHASNWDTRVIDPDVALANP
jgi:hypothetical protein